MKRLQRLTLRQGMGSGTTRAPTSKLKLLALKAKRVRCCSGTGPEGCAGGTQPCSAWATPAASLFHWPSATERVTCLLLWDLIC